MNTWRCNAFFPQEPRSPSLPMIIAFHFVTLVHAFRPLYPVKTQQFFTSMLELGHLLMELCNELHYSTLILAISQLMCRNCSFYINHFSKLFLYSYLSCKMHYKGKVSAYHFVGGVFWQLETWVNLSSYSLGKLLLKYINTLNKWRIFHVSLYDALNY